MQNAQINLVTGFKQKQQLKEKHMTKKKIAVLISGGGSNLQSLIDREQAGFFAGEISLVISNNKNAYGLIRAEQNKIPALHISKKDFPTNQLYDRKLIELFAEYEIDLIVLAGYLRYITPELIAKYPNKIINIHPSLLPAFGGQGFYGANVHQAVYARGAKVSGATVHFVDEGQDTGPIILQQAIALDAKWQPEDIAKYVLRIEHQILPLAVKYFCEDKLIVENNRVYIDL